MLGLSSLKEFPKKRALAALSLAVAMCPAGAASTTAAAASAPTAKQLSALCDTGAVVGTTHTEQREDKATGLGAVGGAVAGGVLGHQVGG
jgi:outer membrane lipoprotein SlyB